MSSRKEEFFMILLKKGLRRKSKFGNFWLNFWLSKILISLPFSEQVKNSLYYCSTSCLWFILLFIFFRVMVELFYMEPSCVIWTIFFLTFFTLKFPIGRSKSDVDHVIIMMNIYMMLRSWLWSTKFFYTIETL